MTKRDSSQTILGNFFIFLCQTWHDIKIPVRLKWLLPLCLLTVSCRISSRVIVWRTASWTFSSNLQRHSFCGTKCRWFELFITVMCHWNRKKRTLYNGKNILAPDRQNFFPRWFLHRILWNAKNKKTIYFIISGRSFPRPWQVKKVPLYNVFFFLFQWHITVMKRSNQRTLVPQKLCHWKFEENVREECVSEMLGRKTRHKLTRHCQRIER